MENVPESLVANVRQVLGDEYRLLSGVGGEVTELRYDLATMNALLRMQSEADEGAVDHFDREWMKQLREVAYDAEDSVDLYKLRVKCPQGDGMKAWWFKVTHLLTTLTQRRRLAGEIRDLRARVAAISERHSRYNIDRKALRSSAIFAPAVGLRSTPALQRSKSPDHNNHNNQFVDIGGQAETFAMQLRKDEHHFKVFSVVGFGGVGKTTLAMEVCQRLAADFPYQAMVSVSQTFQPARDLEKLLKDIIKQVVTPKTDGEQGVKEEKAVGINELGAYLSDKRYLIVIDDVWTVPAWEAIESKLAAAQTNNCGGRIIVTTRIETVAEACSTPSVSGHYIHHMQPLELEDSKKLFLSKAFGKMDATYPEELTDVMDNILKKCCGIPLAIVSVASILEGYRSKDKWERVCKSMGSEVAAHPSLEGMRQIVALSYNHLPHELKRCMMYLSIFPEDYEVDKDRLVSRWIAEGLVPEKRGCTRTEVAETYFDELVSRNMVVPSFIGIDGKVKSCRVHDVLLEVTVSKSLESNFVSLLGEQYAGVSYDDRIRRLSIQGTCSSLGIERGMDVQHVRSLSMFQLQDGHKLLDNLEKFVLLRVLDLEGSNGVTNEHVRHACRLRLLRFLSFKDTSISEVPPQVKKLEHLQVLNLEGTDIDGGGLSDNVTCLKKLECLLFFSLVSNEWVLPKGVGKMKALRKLRDVRLEDDDVNIARELGELEQLEVISICVGATVSEAVLEELARSLSKMHSLRRFLVDGDGCDDKLKFLHTPPRRLRHILIGLPGLRLPTWIGELTHLVEFCMRQARVSGDQLFGVLSKLPCLKRLLVGDLYCVDRKLVASWLQVCSWILDQKLEFSCLLC